MNGCRILVVGGAGFVGSNLVDLLLRLDAQEVVIVDNLLSSDIRNVSLDSRVRFIYGSINSSKIQESIPKNLDYVFHLACFHGNQSSIHDPFSDHENNAVTSLSLFNMIKDFPQLKKVVYAAAACAVAEKTYEDPAPTTEDQPVSLFHDSPYSISKIIGELYGNYFFSRFGLPIVKARFSNVYGPREILGSGSWRGTIHTVWRNVIPTFVWKAIHGEALPLDNGGNASRDFIFVEDMARGLVACAKQGVPGGVYNLATGKETSIARLAELINSNVGNVTPVEYRGKRDWDNSGKRYASTEKALAELGFQAEMQIEDGIKKTVEWTIRNKSLISSCIEKHAKILSQG